MARLEAALFGTFRPVMITPPELPNTLGTIVSIYRNAGSEAVRAISAVMPLLKSADRISLEAVEGSMAPGPKVSDMVGYSAVQVSKP